MKRPSLREILQQGTQQLISGGIKMYLEEHREELLQLLKTAQEERGAALLHDICTRAPAVAGIMQLLMGADANTAISQIEIFDVSLASELRANIGSFRKLQEAYVRGAADRT